MADQVRMTSRTVFADERITVFPKGGPEEGVKNGTVVLGAPFTADRLLARELHALGLADPVDPADLEGEAILEPGYQVSVPQMRAHDPSWTPGTAAGPTATAGSLLPLAPSAASGDGLDVKGVDALRELAAAEEIDLGELKKKPEIVTAIRAARAAKAA